MNSSCSNGVCECRLCLGSQNDTSNAIDLGHSGELRALIKEVYNVEILMTDETPQHICVDCYQRMIRHYKHLMHYRNKKRIVQLNQFVLRSQLKPVEPAESNGNALLLPIKELSVSTNGNKQASKPDVPKPNRTVVSLTGDDSAALATEQNDDTHKLPSNKTARKRTTAVQRADSSGERSQASSSTIETLRPSNERSVAAATSVANHDERSNPGLNVQCKASDTPATTYRNLVVSVVDCLAVPEYLDAIFPLKVSQNEANAKPIQYLCNNCFLTLSSEEALYRHLKQNCSSCCRYCYAQIKGNHSCAFTTKFAYLEPFIKGRDKYCSQKQKETESLDGVSDGAESGNVLKSKDQKPKAKRKKPKLTISKRRRCSVISKTIEHTHKKPPESPTLSEMENSPKHSLDVCDDSDSTIEFHPFNSARKATPRQTRILD